MTEQEAANASNSLDVPPVFSRRVLDLDPASEVQRIVAQVQAQVHALHRRGAVVGLSGGVDSAVVGALMVRALGPNRVCALLMPERDSSADSLRLGREVADTLGVEAIVEDVGPTLTSIGCYARQTQAIREVFPEYGEGWQCKVSLPSVTSSDRLNVFQLTVRAPDGATFSSRMPPSAYLQLVAATNFKQRVRKSIEFYYADKLAYAVAGTPNRLEYDQGFFVKQGDGAADLKPIAHLFKTQVYALAAHLGVPEEIQRRPPTTDTYSMEQTQEEFFFALPYGLMDLCIWALDRAVPIDVVARVLDLSPLQVARVFKDIEAKRRGARYLHAAPLLIEPIGQG
ncbi:MAG: NAD(+) synthase [Polyangiales bacterium]